MAGNQKRPGATRKVGSKKGASTGSGGRGKKALEGKGPTPKAEDRVYHVAHQRKKAAEASAAKSARGGRSSTRRPQGAGETVAGRNAVLEAVRAGVPATELRVFSHIEADDRVTEILSIALESDIPVLEVSKAQLDAVTGGVTHQGVALSVGEYSYATPADLLDSGGTPLIVALDGIQDPRNLGAVIRSAAAFGATGVVIPEHRAAGVTVAAWKTSAGALSRVPVARATNLARALQDFKKARLFVVGLDADGDVAIGDTDLLTGAVVLVIGSEGKGMSRIVREECDVVASIPIAATTESLNASVAASVALYEASRRRALGT